MLKKLPSRTSLLAQADNIHNLLIKYKTQIFKPQEKCITAF